MNLDFLRNPQLKTGFENLFEDASLVRGKNIFVNTITGLSGNDGTSWETPFLTMAAAFAVLASGDVIYVSGKVREQLIAPLGVYGVRVIGADTRPRHDLAASWMAPLVDPVASKALCEIIEQGWVFENLLFVSTTTAPAIKMTRAEDAVHPDPSHAMFIGCRFFGVDGILDAGGCFGVTVKDCQFYALTGTAIKQSGTAIDVPTAWIIDNCQFINNANGIVKPLKTSTIRNCQFTGNTVTINLTGGTAPNFVYNNQFAILAAAFDPTGGVTGVTGDFWYNYLLDAVEQGLPAD